jgi:hypothetical protein
MSQDKAARETGGLEKEVRASLVDGFLPCGVALKLAGRLGVATGEVGYTADALGVRITGCQLGCFKIDKAPHDDLAGQEVSRDVGAGIERSLVAGRLPCPAAHALGRGLGVPLKDIGDAATMLGIKITGCQLGCFV